MIYLPNDLPKAKVLIVAKTYPLPTRSFTELVSMAGLLNGDKWIRIYPVAFEFLRDQQQYPKYSWIELNLTRNINDFRPESYSPKLGVNEPIKILDHIGTTNGWAARKSYVLKEVFTSMNELIKLAKDPNQRKSLATLKPSRIVDFVIEEDEHEWKLAWQHQLSQLNLFEKPEQGRRTLIKKLPYKFSYRFFSEGDKEPRKMMIEDWEIGALFWNCLYRMDGNEQAALELVKQKYLDELTEKDLHFFVGTTKQFHNVAPNPFVIIGVYYGPKTSQSQFLLGESETTDPTRQTIESFIEQRSIKPLKVFLCHSSSDKEKIQDLYRELIKDHYDVWLSEEKLIPGQNWDLEIQKAVRASDIVVVCMSNESTVKAGYLQKEIRLALDIADEQPEGSIFLVPARLEECDVPLRLNRYHWVNLFEENGYKRLKRALETKEQELRNN
jgi:hypothetical protein